MLLGLSETIFTTDLTYPMTSLYMLVHMQKQMGRCRFLITVQFHLLCNVQIRYQENIHTSELQNVNFCYCENNAQSMESFFPKWCRTFTKFSDFRESEKSLTNELRLIHTTQDQNRDRDRDWDGYNRKQWFPVPVLVPVQCVQYIQKGIISRSLSLSRSRAVCMSHQGHYVVLSITYVLLVVW